MKNKKILIVSIVSIIIIIALIFTVLFITSKNDPFITITKTEFMNKYPNSVRGLVSNSYFLNYKGDVIYEFKGENNWETVFNSYDSKYSTNDIEKIIKNLDSKLGNHKESITNHYTWYDNIPRVYIEINTTDGKNYTSGNNKITSFSITYLYH